MKNLVTISPGLKVERELFESCREEKIVFLGHAKDSAEPVKITAWGLNILETDLYVVIANWDAELDGEDRVDNAEYSTILKSTIVQRFIPTGWSALRERP